MKKKTAYVISLIFGVLVCIDGAVTSVFIIRDFVTGGFGPQVTAWEAETAYSFVFFWVFNEFSKER